MDRGDHSQRRHLQAIDDAQWLGASQVVAGERLYEKAEERPLQPSLTSLKAGSKSSKMRFSESKGADPMIATFQLVELKTPARGRADQWYCGSVLGA